MKWKCGNHLLSVDRKNAAAGCGYVSTARPMKTAKTTDSWLPLLQPAIARSAFMALRVGRGAAWQLSQTACHKAGRPQIAKDNTKCR